MYCYKCGQSIDDEAIICPHCGCATKNYEYGGKRRSASFANTSENAVSHKSRLVALLLCVFLGWLGVHRYYVGKIGTGVLWMFTGGCFYIGWIVDIIFLACGKMTDKDGRLILDWDGSNVTQTANPTVSETTGNEQYSVATEPWGNKEQKKNPWYGMLRIVIGAIYLLCGLISFLQFDSRSLLYIIIGAVVIAWGVIDRKKKQKK